MITAVILSTILAAVAVVKRALTPSGVILAWFFCVIITYFGGVTAFAILASTFIFTVAADKLAGKRADPKGIRRKSGARDYIRIFCNVGTGAMAMLLYGITEKQAFFLAYSAVMAASLADSLASKLGPLSERPPIDICSFQRIETGISGGVSFLGLGASLLGGVLIGTIYALCTNFDVSNGTLIAICGLLGSVADSILGSLAQVKYKCSVCGLVTEREEHCGTVTKVYKGFQWINNDMVNLMSNLFVFLLAMLIFCSQN